MRPLRLAAVVLGVLAVPGSSAPAEARVSKVRLTGARCVPATLQACRTGVVVAVGKQVQLRGRGLTRRQRVTFRWTRGALAVRLVRTRAGYTVRVPAGTRPGAVIVYIRDRAGRRSNALRIRVVPPPPRAVLAPGARPLPAPFRGHGMWIWQMSRSEGGDVDAIVARARQTGLSTLYVKAADGGDRWAQLSRDLVDRLHAAGLNVCAWQFVYGAHPDAEARAAIETLSTGVDCFVIDAETRYEGRYAAAQRYTRALRAAAGDAFPIGLTSFPYVHYHPTLPYSVFLGPGGAQANLPQVYWRDVNTTVDRASTITFTQNRIYGVPLAPLGQTYGRPPDDEIQRFRQLWASYGAGGLSWWSWQATAAQTWPVLASPAPAPVALTEPGWPALRRGAKGDQVIWLQQHLAAADPSVEVTATLDSATEAALKRFQTARGLAATGVTDAATWQAALALRQVPADWAAR